MSKLAKEGTIEFHVRLPELALLTNSDFYDFGRFDQPQYGIQLAVVKRADKVIETIISGPVYRTFILEGLITPEIIEETKNAPQGYENLLHVAITWKNAEKVSYYLNAILVQEVWLKELQQDIIGFKIAGKERIPAAVIKTFEKNIVILFNTIYSFQDIHEPYALVNSVQTQLSINKFEEIESRFGSWEMFLMGAKETISFVKNKFGLLNAVINGHSKQLATNHMRSQDAKTGIDQEHLKQEQIKTLTDQEKLKQEKLNTLAQALTIAQQMAESVNSNAALDEDVKKALTEQFLIKPLMNITETLVDNNLTMDVTDSPQTLREHFLE